MTSAQWKRLALLLVSTALSIGLAATVHHFWIAPERMAPSTTIDEGRDYGLAFVLRDGRRVSHRGGKLKLAVDPYTMYRNLPNQQSESYVIDELGYRVAHPRGEGRPIVVLGGSAAFGLGLRGDALTFAARLGTLLARPVVNASVVGHVSSQELAEMVHYADRLAPAAYIVFDGWNDLFDKFEPQRRCQRLAGENGTFGMIERRLVQAFFHEIDEPTPPDSAAPPTTELECFDAVVDTYIANLERMVAFSRGRGANIIVVFQPELGSKRRPSEAEQRSLEVWDRDRRYVADRFSERYARMLESAGESPLLREIAVLDLNRREEIVGSEETLFADPVHLNPRGHEIVAALLAEEAERLRW